MCAGEADTVTVGGELFGFFFRLKTCFNDVDYQRFVWELHSGLFNVVDCDLDAAEVNVEVQDGSIGCRRGKFPFFLCGFCF